MKNLIPLTRKISYWDDIVNSKHNVTKNSLNAIRSIVLKRFKIYRNHTQPNNILENIPASPFNSPNSTLLKDCYSTSNNLTTLKVKIREKQNVLMRAECQYCNISEPSTFDHYLPQMDFPEFSALSINLIPCCPICNNAKGEEWLLNGNRKIINYYYDKIPNVTYLNCSIIYRRNIPQAEFNLDQPRIPVALRAIITNHFDTLKLTERYNKRSNSEITDVFNTINGAPLTRIQIQNQLVNEANQMKTTRGNNYWRALIRYELSNSGRFLSEAGF
jgi:5-methylcytosine-specific restriction endonuclease McrA